jgi:ATP-dependent helicase/nuclease subunit B
LLWICSGADDNQIFLKRNKKYSRTSPNKFLCAVASLREKYGVQVQFLLGPAGSGKTFRCLAEIRHALHKSPEGPPLILLAPKQTTFQLERQLLASHSLDGYTRLRIFSFERLAQFVFEKSGIVPPEQLSDEGRIMVLRALLMRHEHKLKLFRGSARRAGFAQELGGLFNEFRQHQLTPLKLRALAHRPDLRPELVGKLQDLALLNDAYTNWLVEHELQDGNCLLDAATEVLRSTFNLLARRLISAKQCEDGSQAKTAQPSTFNLGDLWLDGFAEMTPQELDLLAAILPFCERATLAFCLDEPGAQKAESSWLSLWSAVGKTYQQCRQRIENLPDCKISVETLKRVPSQNRFTHSPALQFLEANWSQPAQNSKLPPPRRDGCKIQNSIHLVTCQNPDAEAAFAAREILEFVRRGNRFRDCAVLVRSLDAYHKPLARAFRRYDIPFFLDRRESVSHHPLGELTRSAIRTVAFDWRQEDWFAALKAGFSPVDETETPLHACGVDRLENEALARGWRGAKWFEPVQIADDPQLEKSLEQLRKKILPPFENFAKQLVQFKNAPTGEQLAVALRGLWSDLKVESTLERWSLVEPDSFAIRNSQLAIHQTVWDQMNLWLENLALAFSREPLPLRDWLPILEAGLANLTVGVIPPVLDEVLVGAVDRARNPDLKLALVLGVNESVFPAVPATSTILTETDRDELSHAVALGPDLRERLARERYYGYIACTRAREKLVVTLARNDADGKTLNPSPLIAHLRRIFPKLEVEESPTNTDWREAEHVNDLIQPLVEIQISAPRPSPLPAGRGEGGPRKAGPGEGWLELLEIPILKLLAENLRQLREPNSAECLSPALAEKIYGVILQTSVSRLEKFAQCPFRFFVHSGLRAEERKVFELDVRERGSFQHEVLKMFHEQLSAEGKRWRDLTPSEAHERVGKIALELMKSYRGGLLRDTAQSEFEARMMVGSLQDFVETLVGWMRGQYEFDPVAAELEFGDGKTAPAWKVDLNSGHKLALRGRIDRVDLYRETDDSALCVVMDYKSGGRKQKLDAILVEHGVQLQLLAYLNALRYWPNPRALLGTARLVPAGVFYVNLRGQYENGGTRTEVLTEAGDARKRAYRHTGRFDADALPKLDSAGAADQFNYRLNQDSSLHKGSVEALPRAEFDALLDRVEMQLREMGDAIFSGDAKVDPYRKGSETPCKFCDYRAVCRIDPWTHRYRVLRSSI